MSTRYRSILKRNFRWQAPSTSTTKEVCKSPSSDISDNTALLSSEEENSDFFAGSRPKLKNVRDALSSIANFRRRHRGKEDDRAEYGRKGMTPRNIFPPVEPRSVEPHPVDSHPVEPNEDSYASSDAAVEISHRSSRSGTASNEVQQTVWQYDDSLEVYVDEPTEVKNNTPTSSMNVFSKLSEASKRFRAKRQPERDDRNNAMDPSCDQYAARPDPMSSRRSLAETEMTPKVKNRQPFGNQYSDPSHQTIAQKLKDRYKFVNLKSWLEGKKRGSIQLYPDEYDASMFQKVQHRLCTSLELRSVDIFRSWEKGQRKTNRTDDEMKLFFAAVHSLPKLKSLVQWNLAQSDLSGFRAVEANSNLRHLFIHLSEGSLDNPPIIKGIVQLPKLHNLELQVKCSFPVAKLLHSQSLRMLKVSSRSFVFETEHIVKLAKALAYTHRLVSLEIEPSINARSLHLLAKAMERNTKLKSLSYSYSGKGAATDRAMSQVAQTLQSNSCLERIINKKYYNISPSTQVQQELLTAIQSNPRLQVCRIIDEDALFWTQKSLSLKRSRPAQKPHHSYFDFSCASSPIIQAFASCGCHNATRH